MSDYTKGPYRVHVEADDRFAFAKSSSVYICTTGEWPESQIARVNVMDGLYEREANAALFAAAPDLLKACLAMICWDDAEKNAKPFDDDNGAAFYRRLDMCDQAFAKARAAIAKALPPASSAGRPGEETGE